MALNSIFSDSLYYNGIHDVIIILDNAAGSSSFLARSRIAPVGAASGPCRWGESSQSTLLSGLHNDHPTELSACAPPRPPTRQRSSGGDSRVQLVYSFLSEKTVVATMPSAEDRVVDAKMIDSPSECGPVVTGPVDDEVDETLQIMVKPSERPSSSRAA